MLQEDPSTSHGKIHGCLLNERKGLCWLIIQTGKSFGETHQIKVQNPVEDQ